MFGGTQNMTAYTYGNNLAGNISFTRSKKQTNILEVAKCLSLPAYAEHLTCLCAKLVKAYLVKYCGQLIYRNLCHLYNCIVPKL